MSLLTELCGRIPLALRIAGERASRFADHGLAELAEELSDEHQRLDQLGDHDDRAADLRAAFSWSYRTLTTDDARTFRLLGLYPAGTIGLPAAAALTGVSISQMRRSSDRLVAHHLLEQPERGRFKLHDLLRLYAAELVAEREPAPAVEAATRRLLDWYLHNAAVAGGVVRPRGSVNPVVGPADPNIVSHEFAGPAEALDWFETERQVLPDLLRRAADHGFDDHVWKLAWTLLPFYSIRMHLDDWRTTATIGRLAADRLGDPRAVLFTANNEGIMHLHSSRLDESRVAFTTALEMARQLGDHARQATSLSNLGLVADTRGDHEQAIEHYELALVAEAASEPDVAVFTTWLNLSASHGALGHFREAIRYGELAVDYFRQTGNTAYEAQALANIGEGHLSLGDFDLARSYCEQSLDLFGTLEAKHGKANTLMVLGRVHEATGAVEAAARVWEEAYDLLHEAGDPRGAEVQKLLRSLEDHPAPPA
jgi:tetratricopeptide (TPR) repeat protein